MAYPYVPQSGPDFVPLNTKQLPRRYWFGFGLVLLALTVLTILLTTY